MPEHAHPGHSIDHARWRIKQMVRQKRCGRMIGYGIRLKRTSEWMADQAGEVHKSQQRGDLNELIGVVSMHARIGEGALEIGYWISQPHTRCGYASEAAGALTVLGMTKLRVCRMEIQTDPANGASMSVARKLGYVHQAVIRDAVISAACSIRDSAVWAMTRDHFVGSTASLVSIHVL